MDFNVARKNMVECQIQTNGVINPEILEAFSIVPKEIFMPSQFKNMAYSDNIIQISADRYALEPMIYAKMLQALKPKASDVVLDIGGGTGYSAAILAQLTSTVIALEDDDSYVEAATINWKESGSCNAVPVKGALSEGYDKSALYDIIMLGGAVAEVPQGIASQLSTDNGRLITIVKGAGEVMGKVTLLQRVGDNISSLALFEASAPYIRGFEPVSEFEF